MLTALPPVDEAERLHVLRRFAILDTLPEAAFDNLVELAAQICAVPIALMSLVDEDRQWFKARVGLDAASTSRDHSFCAHAIAMPKMVMLVEDALLDERFRDNPFVTGDPKIRFYAGAPIVTADGHALGTICAIDRRPRHLDPNQVGALESLAKLASVLVERRAIAAREAAQAREAQRLEAERLSALAAEGLNLKVFVDRDLERGERSFVPVDLGEVIDEVTTELREAIVRTSARVDASTLPSVLGERSLLRLLFQNLVANALEFSRPGVPPAVTISVHAAADATEIRILDNGIGLAEDQLEKVFDVFYRVESRSACEGTGLGLAICRSITDLHRGRIWATAKEGQGVCMHVMLPAVA